MKFNKSDGSSSIRGPSPGVTKENYLVRSRAFMCGQDGFVIRAAEGEKGDASKATDAQWIAWMRWFDQKKIPSAFTKSYGLATVPCEWPEDFDSDAPYSDRSLRLPTIDHSETMYGRRLPKHLRPQDMDTASRRPRRPNIDVEAELAKLKESEARNSSTPCVLSNDARLGLGFPALPINQEGA
jgi:hypothetical protein